MDKNQDNNQLCHAPLELWQTIYDWENVDYSLIGWYSAFRHARERHIALNSVSINVMFINRRHLLQSFF